MALNVEKEMAALGQMTAKELQQRYAEVHGEEPRGRNRQWLIRRIIWRLQALEEGDLSERARRRAMELANDADLRVTAPRGWTKTTVVSPAKVDARLPMPNTALTREYQGRTYEVLVLRDGFRFEGEHYRSLSAVAKAINTTHSMGRLTLNILLSFAQFEREVISERTRDKIAATRRKGQWCGGPPILGYDVESDVRGPRLVVNRAEAERVREIFALYVGLGSLLAVVKELACRDWRTKRWTTRKGHERGGRVFDKNRLHALLTNVTYAGKLAYRDEVHAGVHKAIVDTEMFEQVQELLRENQNGYSTRTKEHSSSLLKGLLFCGPCDCTMFHTYSQRGNRRYRYYVCQKAQKQGRHTCPSKSVPAGEMERFVVDHIRGVGKSPEVVAETIARIREKLDEEIAALEAEELQVKKRIAEGDRQVRRLARDVDRKTGLCRRQVALADAQQRVELDQRQWTEVREEIVERKRQRVDDADVKEGLAAFEPVWESLSVAEQSRLLDLLIESVVYDGNDSTIAVTLRPTGITEFANSREEAEE